MSLDVDLYPPNRPETSAQAAIALLRSKGFEKEADFLDWRYQDPDYIGASFSANITHNLNAMAKEAGIYEACWRPEEIGVTTAAQLIPLLEAGLALLKSDRPRFEAFNPENGWGTYENLVSWVVEYIYACKQHPDHIISVSR